MAEFRMPSLGTDMEAGTLVTWHVRPGDHVQRSDIIADVETEKGIIEVEVFEAGVVEQLFVQPGTRVPVGTVLALLRPESSAARPAPDTAETPTPALVVEQTPARLAAAPLSPAAARPVQAGKRLRISPLARRLAAELGIDLHTIQGTGPEGAIARADVERAAAARPSTPVADLAAAPASPAARLTVPSFQAGMRRAIAAAMSRSKREIPHYYLQTRIDMSRALRWLEAANQQRSITERLLPAVLLIRAVARALGEVPALNGYWIDEALQTQEAIHLGFAIALRQGGLVAPAIHHADLKSPDELMASLRDLITRVRAGRLRSSELADATATVTNLGDLGVETVYGVIYPPQVALIGFGKILEQPWAEQGMLGIRPVVTATLAADHRATDGNQGARFLEALNHFLQEVAS
ncbi:MAG: dihydrolipoamide acetyltransferase family protein [Candidatus Tectimicrobiota bacterium]